MDGEEESVSPVNNFLELEVHTCIIPIFTLYRIVVSSSSSPFSIVKHLNSLSSFVASFSLFALRGICRLLGLKIHSSEGEGYLFL